MKKQGLLISIMLLSVLLFSACDSGSSSSSGNTSGAPKDTGPMTQEQRDAFMAQMREDVMQMGQAMQTSRPGAEVQAAYREVRTAFEKLSSTSGDEWETARKELTAAIDKYNKALFEE